MVDNDDLAKLKEDGIDIENELLKSVPFDQVLYSKDSDSQSYVLDLDTLDPDYFNTVYDSMQKQLGLMDNHHRFCIDFDAMSPTQIDMTLNYLKNHIEEQ